MPTYNAGDAALSIVPDARGFKARLDADLKRVNAEYAVQITADLARARADLDKFRAEQEAKAIHLRAEVDRDHLRKSFDGLKGDFENLGSTLGKALKIDAATVGIDLLPSLATGLASVAQALQQVTQAGLAVPGILAGVGASVGTLALGLSGVKDAWSAVDKAASVSGATQAQQAQQAITATNALRNAKIDEANAQKDVANAYKDARHQLEDLNIEQRGGLLSEKEAILEASKARRDLATGRFKDALDYESAQLRVEEADQRVVQARQHNIELQEKVGDANAKGIAGSDQVVAANERLVRSHQAVQSAQASLADLGAGGGADKAAEALAKLAPNAREFVQTLIGLKPAFTDLRNTVQQNLFAEMSQSLKHLSDADLPNLKRGLGGIATSLNQDFRQLFTSLGSDSTRGLIDRILGDTANADARMKGAIDPIVHAVGVLSAAGADSLPRLADAIDRIAERFDHFISAAADDGRLSKWINDGLTGMTHLGDIALNLGKSFTAVTKAIGGEGLLASLDRATGKMAAFLDSASGQQKLTKFFQEGRDEFHKWEPVIENLAKMLPPMFAAAKDNADQFLPIIKDITSTLAKNPDLVKEITDGFLLWETVIKPITEVGKAIQGLTTLYEGLKLMINGTRDAALVANGAMAAGTAGGAGAAAGGLGGGAGAAAAGGLGGAAAIIGPGIAAGVGASILEQQIDKNAVPLGGNPNLVGGTRDYTEKDVAGLTVPPGFPKPGSPEAELAMSGLARTDPAAAWVVSTQNKWDQAARYAWLMNHPEVERQSFFQPPTDYLTKAPKPKPPGAGVDSPPGGDAGFEAGGPTPHNSGPLSDGGYHAIIHPKEYVANALGRSTLGDKFLGKANKGVIDISSLPHFDVGGPGNGLKQFTGLNDDQMDYHGHIVAKPQTPADWAALSDFYHNAFKGSGPADSKLEPGWRSRLGPADGEIPGGIGDPARKLPHFDVGGPGDKNAGPNPADVGPPQVAPSPMGGGGGTLNQVIGGIASGVQGPIGNVIGLIQQGASRGFGGGGTGGGGGGMIPGIWGLAQAGGNPDAMNAWTGQTANWLANFGSKTLMSGAQIGLQGVLGGLGLGGSILSPSNPYNQAIQRTASFYTGDQSPFASMFGGGGADLSGGGIGSQTITLPTGETIQVPTSGTSQGIPQGGLPGASDNTASPAALRAIQYAQAHAVGQPYSYGGVGPNYDCSGIASAIYAAAKGLPQGTRYFTTESDFAALGFTPGYQPGSLNIGVMRGGGGPNSHMVLTLPNGVNVESGGASDTTQYGGGAKGARDLPLQFHLVLPGSMPPPGGIPGLPPALYDEGGILPVGMTLANNQTGKPEAVLTHQQNQALQTVANHISAPGPGQPQIPDAGHLQQPASPVQQPPSAPEVSPPSPAGGVAPPTTQGATGGAISPSLSAPAVAPAPTSLDHNLKAIDTGIDSGAQAIGQAISTAIGIAGGAAGGFGGGAIGAIGPYAAGLAVQGGKIVKDVVNVGSSFLVGNVTPGTQDLAYGSTLRAPQNTPNTAPMRMQNNTFNGMDIPKVFQELDLREAQEHQSALASHPRISA